MERKKRSPLLAIVLAAAVCLMVIALMTGFIRPVPVIVARVALAPGTPLSAELLEARTVPAAAKPEGAFSTLEEVEGKLLAVGRAPGDLILASVLGEAPTAGIPAQLPEGHVALAVQVDLASGVAGLLRPGQTVTVIGLLTPDVLQNSLSVVPVAEPPAAMLDPDAPLVQLTPTPQPPSAPLARLAISGLRVLMVPQSFRYEELPPGSDEDQLYASARTTMAAQGSSVIVLDVPTAVIEVLPGLRADPASLLAALDRFGQLTLALEPANGLQPAETVTLNLGDLYNALNAERGVEER